MWRQYKDLINYLKTINKSKMFIYVIQSKLKITYLETIIKLKDKKLKEYMKK